MGLGAPSNTVVDEVDDFGEKENAKTVEKVVVSCSRVAAIP